LNLKPFTGFNSDVGQTFIIWFWPRQDTKYLKTSSPLVNKSGQSLITKENTLLNSIFSFYG